jgi:hypothetical protein
MRISTCFILKQFGVPSVTKITREIFASTHITGRTTDAHPTNTNTRSHSAQAGKLKRIQRLIKMGAGWSIGVVCATGGRSWSTILNNIRHLSAARLMEESAAKLTVHSTIWKVKSGNF